MNCFRPEFSPSPVSRSDWDSFLTSSAFTNLFEIHSDAFCKGRAIPWTWRFDDTNGTIEIDVRTVMEARITNTSISSPLLNGEWWSPISDLRVSQIDEKMRISFRPDSRWPLLIRTGDSIDRQSMFVLALYSMHVKAPPRFFIGWITMAASLGEPSAQYWLGRVLLDQEKPESAYWLARSILEHADGESTVVLCWMLWGGSDDFRKEFLAESLLVSEANNGNGDAIMQLGWFYANGGKEVAKNVPLGKKLLEIAAVSFQNQEAQKKLQQIEQDPTLVDYAILFGLAAGVITGGVWLWRRVFRRL
jgi:hypothetical protein